MIDIKSDATVGRIVIFYSRKDATKLYKRKKSSRFLGKNNGSVLLDITTMPVIIKTSSWLSTFKVGKHATTKSCNTVGEKIQKVNFNNPW